jgi:hypothetical protein
MPKQGKYLSRTEEDVIGEEAKTVMSALSIDPQDADRPKYTRFVRAREHSTSVGNAATVSNNGKQTVKNRRKFQDDNDDEESLEEDS